jgi:glycerol-3-phosphate dehydrogenase (NAD(P)+)
VTQASQATLAVLGAGAWGTVLASLLARNGHAVRLWARRKQQAERINLERENQEYAPGLPLPATLVATADLRAAVRGAAAVVVAVPTQHVRSVAGALPDVPAFISACKGFEVGSFKRPSEILGAVQPRALLAALSGPNLAREIAAGLPAAATLAAQDAAFTERAQGWFWGEGFRVYRSADLTGVEVAGAFKNVIALAAGMSDGLGLGDNAKATLVTRGLAEMRRLAEHLGGHPATIYGLAGLGDLVATCSSRGSRNHTAGERVAAGATLQELSAERLTAEGIPTVRAVRDYALEHGLELPIAAEVYRVVYEEKPPLTALRDLMARAAGAEA